MNIPVRHKPVKPVNDRAWSRFQRGNASKLRHAWKIPWHSARDMVRYAIGLPVKYQRLWIEPMEITDQIDSENRHLQKLMLGDACSRIPETDRSYMTRLALKGAGSPILSNDFDLYTIPVTNHRTFQMAVRKFDCDLTWEEAGFYTKIMPLIHRHGAHDGCKSLEDVVARYARLEGIVHEVKKTGRLAYKGAAHLTGGDVDGILVLVGRSGKIIFANAGTHRLAIASYFRVPCEVHVCAVHVDAVKSGAWKKRVNASQSLSVQLTRIL